MLAFLLMNKILDEELSLQVSVSIKSKVEKPFDNAYKAALCTKEAIYVQGFVVICQKPYHPIESAWLELTVASSMGETSIHIIDPNFKYLTKKTKNIWYFPAQSLNMKKMKSIIEESKEDYPEDNPLPIYGKSPYEYYGDVMLGGKEYLVAYEKAIAKCQELSQLDANHNGRQ